MTTGTVKIQGTGSLPFRNLVSSQQSEHQGQQEPRPPYLVFQCGSHSNNITSVESRMGLILSATARLLGSREPHRDSLTSDH